MDALKREDYAEPSCPFCTDGLDGKKTVHPIDVCRMTEKLNAYLDRNNYDAAERHLQYWLAEAQNGNDERGALSVRNEQMGLYRKRGKREEALNAVRQALSLLRALQFEGTLTTGTTYVNVATVYKAFGMAKDALPLYRAAQEIYEKSLREDDARLGGLYNNMALALADEKQFREAEACYRKALTVMAQVEHGEAEAAITYLNMADLAAEELGLLASEEIVSAYLDKAEALLQTPTLPRNGYYAFVCEKCAPTFDYFGRFAYARELKERSEEIYART